MSLKSNIVTAGVIVTISMTTIVGSALVLNLFNVRQGQRGEEKRTSQMLTEKESRISKYFVELQKTKIEGEFSLWKQRQAGLVRELGTLLDHHNRERKAFLRAYDARPVTLENSKQLDTIMSRLDKIERRARQVLNRLEKSFQTQFGQENALREELEQVRDYLQNWPDGAGVSSRLISHSLRKLDTLTDPYQQAFSGFLP